MPDDIVVAETEKNLIAVAVQGARDAIELIGELPDARSYRLDGEPDLSCTVTATGGWEIHDRSAPVSWDPYAYHLAPPSEQELRIYRYRDGWSNDVNGPLSESTCRAFAAQAMGEYVMRRDRLREAEARDA